MLNPVNLSVSLRLPAHYYMETPVSHVVRPLGMVEKYHSCAHALNFYFNIAGTARYHILTPNLSREHIRNRLLDALCEVTSQHPPMCVSICGQKTNSPAFVRVPSIDIPARVTYIDGGDKDDLQVVEKVLEDEHNSPFPGLDDGTGQLWKLIIFEHSQYGWVSVAWVVHHALSDGIGVKVFQVAFGEALTASSAFASEWERERWTVRPPDNLKLPDPLEKAVDISPSYRSAPGLLLSLYKLYTPSFMHFKREKGIYSGPLFPTESALPTFRSNHRIAVLSSQVAGGLRLMCRENGTTVSAYMLALMARVIKDIYPGYEGGYAANSPISGRRFAPGAEDQIVDYVSDLTLVVKFNRPSVPSGELSKEEREAEDWANSRECGKSLRTAAKKSRDTHSGHLAFVADYFSYFKGKLGITREGAIEVNSIGLIKKPKKGEWEMDRLVHTLCGGVLNSAFILSLGTVEDGDMGISVSWSEWEGGITSREEGDRVIRGLVEGLMELLHLKDFEGNVIWAI